MTEIISKILELLDKCENAIEIAQLVLFALVTKRCSKLSKLAEEFGKNTLPVPEQAQTVATEPSATPKQIKKQYTDLFKEGYELYMSDKDEADMTAEELRKYEAVKTFIEGGM